MRVSHFIYGLLVSSLFVVMAKAQEMRTASGEYTLRFTSEMSRGEARALAYERAKLDAILSVFPGTINATTNSLSVSNTSTGSATNFYSISASEVKGEWLGDVLEPKYEYLPYDEKNDLDGITCKVTGRVREINWSRPEFQWTLMRNHPTERDAAEEFVEGDDLFLSFTAPCNGYLAVYNVDGTGAEAQCLIPSSEQPEGIYKVKSGKRYVFFAKDIDNQDNMIPPYPDGISLYCDETIEHFQFYVIFSPNKFTRAVAIAPSEKKKFRNAFFELPPELPNTAFQKWLLDLRTHDRSLQCEKKIISVSKR